MPFSFTLPMTLLPTSLMSSLLLTVLSLLFGNIIALVQTNIKRVIAYSTISNMGFVLIGIVKIYNEECLTYIIFYSIGRHSVYFI